MQKGYNSDLGVRKKDTTLICGYAEEIFLTWEVPKG